MSTEQDPKIGNPGSQRVLNRLLALEQYSLANYLLQASPWVRHGDEPLFETVRSIAADQEVAAARIAAILVQRHGYAESSQFPTRFPAYNYLAMNYLARKLIDEIARCVEQLDGDPEAKQLAEEVLASEKHHLGLLTRLAPPAARSEASHTEARQAA